MSSLLLRILLCLFLPMIFLLGSGADEPLKKQWCIANEQAPVDVLQKALDWACGIGGASCSAIQVNQPCYDPNTVKDHASYAFNSYWQKFKSQGATCDFNGAGMVTETDPSHGSCIFEFVPLKKNAE